MFQQRTVGYNFTQSAIKNEHEHIECNLTKCQQFLIIFISIYFKMNLVGLHCLKVSLTKITTIVSYSLNLK